MPFSATPSIFFFATSDRAFRIAAWLGVLVSCLALSGIAQRSSALAAAAMWALLWALYLSFVNVGQTFYAFGWESLLLEAGFFAIFLGAASTPPHALLNWIYRWTLFRLMFGAGLIKIRGDACWRNLTCLDYYFETQPIPNGLSWYLHHLPRSVLHGGVAVNHFVELIVPFGFFLPQPFCGLAGLITIAFQLMLIAQRQPVVAQLADDRPGAHDARQPVVVVAAGVDSDAAIASDGSAHRGLGADRGRGVLSIAPTLNMLSSEQVMNSSFNSLQIVNMYGAFGSVTRERYEIIIEGSADEQPSDQTVWREYEFKGKPGDPSKRPVQVAPYHLRIDWLMWFAAMSSARDYPWFPELLRRLLEGDRAVEGLLAMNPFPDRPPRWVRAQLYLYRFTTPAERAANGQWWHRELAGPYFPAVRLPPS